MILYTDGEIPATEAEIKSAYAYMMQAKRKTRSGGRKSILSTEKRNAVLNKLLRGATQPEVAKELGVARSTVARIVKMAKQLEQAEQQKAD